MRKTVSTAVSLSVLGEKGLIQHSAEELELTESVSLYRPYAVSHSAEQLLVLGLRGKYLI